MCTVKHVTFDTEVACFPSGTPILARKVAFGPRVHAKTQRTTRYFRRRNQPREGIRTYIYIYMYILNSRRSPKIPDAAPRNVSSGPGPTLPLAKMNEPSRRSRPGSPGGDAELDGMNFILKKSNPIINANLDLSGESCGPPFGAPRPWSLHVFSARVRPGFLDVTCFLSPMATSAPRSDIFSGSDCDPVPSK